MNLAEIGRLVFADSPPRAFPFLVQGSYIAGALLAGAAIIALVARWRKKEADAKQDASDQLAHFRLLHEKGEISQEEFDSLRRVLGGELRRRVKAVPHPELIEPAAPKTTDVPPVTENNGPAAKDGGAPPDPGPKPVDPEPNPG